MTIAALNPEHGGPARTLPALSRALTHLGAEVEIITVAEHCRPIDANLSKDLTVTSIVSPAGRYHPWSWRRAFQDSLFQVLNGRRDIVLYDLGLWLPSNHFAADVALRTKTPLVVSPRGMLSPEALKVSKWKKRAAWWLYQRGDVKRASVFHATSEEESNDIRRCKFSQTIAVVPNGVELPLLSDNNARKNEPRTALFLSRIHPIKGLKDLVAAWAQIRPGGWRLVIAGPDEQGHQSEIETLAESLGIEEAVTFTGQVSDEVKWRLLQQADLFILPSYSESFGMAIAEALASGVPVITSHATPWRDIETARCGWWIKTGVEQLAATIMVATSATREELRAMGERGRRLVQESYSWETAAKKILPVFEWLVGHGRKPDWLIS